LPFDRFDAADVAFDRAGVPGGVMPLTAAGSRRSWQRVSASLRATRSSSLSLSDALAIAEIAEEDQTDLRDWRLTRPDV
jgi:hypothetical protein